MRDPGGRGATLHVLQSVDRDRSVVAVGPGRGVHDRGAHRGQGHHAHEDPKRSSPHRVRGYRRPGGDRADGVAPARVPPRDSTGAMPPRRRETPAHECRQRRNHPPDRRDAVRRRGGRRRSPTAASGPRPSLPLVMLQHFRGNLDNWDPALTDALAAEREIILVDYPGVGSSTGEPSSLDRRDGAPDDRVRRRARARARSTCSASRSAASSAQEIALVRPTLVRRLVLAATGPKGAPGMHGWREDIAAAARARASPRTSSTSCSRTPTRARRRARSSSAASSSARRHATHRRATPPATRSTTRSSTGASPTTPRCSG